MKNIESRQQIVETIGLSWFLSERLYFLNKKSESDGLLRDEAEEIGKIEIALKPSITAAPKCKLHATEASNRISQLIKKGNILAHADVVYLQAMNSYPERMVIDPRARRLAFLKAMSDLELLTEDQEAEMSSLAETYSMLGN